MINRALTFSPQPRLFSRRAAIQRIGGAGLIATLAASGRRGTATAAQGSDFDSLLAYMGISETTFAPFEAAYFVGLSDLLGLYGVFSPAGVFDRETFGDGVRQFQSEHGLDADGIPGQDTLWEMQAPVAEARALELIEVPADIWVRPPRTIADHDEAKDGYDFFRLRADVADMYLTLRDAAIGAGATITSAGSYRRLSEAVGKGRSATSFHYAALALDLATVSGMLDPEVDPYIVTSDGDYWRVWARTAQGMEQTLDAVVWSGGKTDVKSVTARVLDFTALAVSHGFERIRPRSAFPEDYLSAEWWHFQCEAVVTPWISQFGIEMLALSVYDAADLQPSPTCGTAASSFSTGGPTMVGSEPSRVLHRKPGLLGPCLLMTDRFVFVMVVYDTRHIASRPSPLRWSAGRAGRWCQPACDPRGECHGSGAV